MISPPATGEPVQVGEAVGIIAAQSIGEPGTRRVLFRSNVDRLEFEDVNEVLEADGKLSVPPGSCNPELHGCL